ncbi:hypothetical protein Tco_0863214 [Tanacetum coccineum]
MEDEDIGTILEKGSDKDNKSSAENLVQNPSESEATSDNESDSTSSEYSSDNESVLEDEHTNYLIDSIIDLSPKIDPILEQFTGELTLINPMPPGIDEVDFNPEGDTRLIEKLSYDNSSPRPPEELNSKDIIEFFSAFPIPVEGSDSLLEEFNIIPSYLDDSLPELETFSFDIEEKNSGSTTTHFDYSLPIYEKFSFHDDPTEEKNSGSTTIHAEISLPEYESFNDKSDYVSKTFDDDSTNGVQIRSCSIFPFGNRNKTFDPGISIEVQSKRFLSLNKFSISFISDPHSPVLETLLPFLSKNEDKVFNPGILILNEEKSPHLLSHRGFKVFKIIHKFLNESLIMIYGGDIPIWDVPYLHFYPP